MRSRFLELFRRYVFGIVAGYDLKGISDITINTAGIMELFPTVVKMIVNGLIPISEPAKKFLTKHFADRELYIGFRFRCYSWTSDKVNIGRLNDSGIYALGCDSSWKYDTSTR